VFDHVVIPVTDMEAAAAFYGTVLAPVGLELERGEYVELGPLTFDVWDEVRPMHFAFMALERSEVDAFHAAGVEAGYRSNGGPGIRRYASDYYAAYLLDPDGHNVEVVHRAPETRARWDFYTRFGGR
jgi:catechol 2,3-dioxygenase-like lactoylglutathione lyase family enzyme